MFKKGRTILFSSIVIAIVFFLFPLSSYGATTTDTFTSTPGGIILSGITPDPFGFGVTLTLSGNGFGEEKGSVMFGSAKAKIIEWHDTSITCSLSKGSAGTYPVKVVIKKVGESNVVDCPLSGPVINNIDPSSGDPKTYVTINGQYFGTKKPKVNFIDSNNKKKKSAKVTAYSDNQLTIVIPKVTPGTYQVMVQNSAGTSDGYEFYVGTPPAVTFTLNVNTSPSAGGTVTGTGINCPGDCSETCDSGTNDNLTANANSGYTLSNWTGCDAPSGNLCTMTMNSNKSVTANFSPVSTAAVDGIIKDADGSLINEVTVKYGTFTTTSSSDGSYYFTASPGKDQVVVFSHEGYVTISRFVNIFSGSTTHLYVTMLKETNPVTLDSSVGGTISGERNASAAVPENAFVDDQDNPVSGTVNIHLTPFDPSIQQEAAAYPGNLRGRTMEGKIVPLETFGVLDVTARQNGKTLRLKSGKTIDIRVPAPSNGVVPATSQMWTFDEETALWIQNPTDGTYDTATHTYLASVNHLTSLNCDRPREPTCITGLVLDANNNPVNGAFVEAIPTTGGESSDYTDKDGYVCMYVERNAQMEIKVTIPLTETCPETMRDGNKCVTTRFIMTGGDTVSGEYPANCSKNCKKIRTVVIGKEDPGPLNEAECQLAVGSGSNNPFSLSCAEGLTDFYKCFAPEGACTYEMDPFSPSSPFILTFANGSKMVSEYDIISGMQISVYGPEPSNTLCGTMTTSESGFTITTASRKKYTFRTTDSGSTEIECPDGYIFTLNAAQVNALSGCNGTTQSDGSSVECKAKSGTFLAECAFDWDCNFGYKCCGPFLGKNVCLLPDLCSIICSNDSDCPTISDICCNAGTGFNMCLPVEACSQ